MPSQNEISHFELEPSFDSSIEKDKSLERNNELENAAMQLAKIESEIASQYGLDPHNPELRGRVDVAVADYIESAASHSDEAVVAEAADTGTLEVYSDERAINTGYQLGELPVDTLGNSLQKLGEMYGDPSVEAVVTVIETAERREQGWDQFDHVKNNKAEMVIPPKPEYAPTVHLEQHEKGGEYSNTEKVIDDALERADSMSERGVERSEFAGEEVEDAIESYYGDQEVALSLMESFDGVPSDEQIAEISALRNDDNLGVESEIYNQIFTGLESAKTDEERRAIMEAGAQLLYTEPCIGQLTLEQEDITHIAERKHALLKSINPDNKYNTNEGQIKDIENAKQTALNEVRSAGQLMFHNTSFGRAIEDRGGYLQGRFAQEKAHGNSLKSQADVEGHSQLVHFSEFYEPYNYKGTVGGASAEEWRSETYAIPLKNIIEQAPIAGGLEMSTVSIKENSSFKPVELKGANVNKVGAGESQYVGSDRLAKDRVFWADGDSQESAASYNLSLNSEDVYVLQSAYDRENSGGEEATKEAMVKALGVDVGEGRSPENISTGELLSHAYHNMREELKRYDKPADLSPGVWRNPKAQGLREQVIEYINDKVAGSRNPNMSYQYVDLGGDKKADESMYGTDNEQITKIMEQSAKKFEGRVVVPLRAAGGDFSYVDSGDAFAGGDNVAQGTFNDRVRRMKYRSRQNA